MVEIAGVETVPDNNFIKKALTFPSLFRGVTSMSVQKLYPWKILANWREE